MNKRLVFLVEGDSELAFVDNMVVPYLYANTACGDWAMYAQKITTNRKLNKRGGNISYQYLKNEIDRLKPQGVWITTMLDFFRLPTDFPGFTTDGRKVGDVEQALTAAVAYNRFIPYIQKYEFESLLFSDFSGFEFCLDDDNQLDAIRKIITDFPNPEDINGGPDTAPSKRLQRIFPYQKTSDSELILSELNIDKMREKCPRFNKWIANLLKIIA